MPFQPILIIRICQDGFIGKSILLVNEEDAFETGVLFELEKCEIKGWICLSICADGVDHSVFTPQEYTEAFEIRMCEVEI
jgi:hypothetical protein